QLAQTSAKTADQLQGSCPSQVGETPTARLDAMNNRLNAMVQAVKSLRPALGAFYATLSDEQKAQFNAMGQQSTTLPEHATSNPQQ
ncbi:MAG TPA: Spy/CpxP family protein refolding chaperone, partial [Xanthobacteraceae bacterium]|nr:Spy/CpxP family protein refolding chaperone [Xanthobacteraceae bacterium]